MSSTALIGSTGFVGSNLAAQIPFDALYRSTNIAEIEGREFDTIVCAGIQAKKWWANANAEPDWVGISGLLEILKTVRVRRFILISTVDVYPDPANVDEDVPVDPQINHAYGKHRFWAEEFVRGTFPDHLILRLPGLFGDGIKKNVIHDLLNRHETEKINPAGVYQYYFLDQLAADIGRAEQLGLRLLNISAEPVCTREILARFFPETPTGPETAFHAAYDMRSKYWKDWSSTAPGYLYEKATVLTQLETFITREKTRLAAAQ
jgi:nucleoside-diphosphate-sugar epimerase